MPRLSAIYMSGSKQPIKLKNTTVLTSKACQAKKHKSINY